MPLVRVGAVSYLNTRPLVHGLERGLAAGRVELSYGTPAELAERMAVGALDVALLPVIELARIPDLELVPGLAIATRGASRSVLLVSRRPLEQVAIVALDPESRTSNALCRVLFARAADRPVSFVDGASDLVGSLERADAAVRIGDKALFEPLPAGLEVHDLGAAWTAATGLPFVFAAWAARPGVVDRELYRALHDSRREGARAIGQIAAEWRWRGAAYPELVRAYLTRHIVYRLGAAELSGLRLFFEQATAAGLIAAPPQIRLAFERHTACHEAAAVRGAR